MANSQETMHQVLATLEDCQKTLARGGDRDTAQLVAVAILELRIKLNQIQDSELKILCDAMLNDVEAARMPFHPRPPEAPVGRSPASLRLVK